MPELIEVEEAPHNMIGQSSRSSVPEKPLRSNGQPAIAEDAEDFVVLGGLVNQIDDEDWLI